MLLEHLAAAVMDVARSLEARGIAVRAFANLPVVGPSIRVGMGPWPMLTVAPCSRTRSSQCSGWKDVSKTIGQPARIDATMAPNLLAMWNSGWKQ